MGKRPKGLPKRKKKISVENLAPPFLIKAVLNMYETVSCARHDVFVILQAEFDGMAEMLVAG